MASSSNSIHEARLKAKAKRRLRKNSSRDSGRGDSLSDNGDVVRGTSVAPTSPKSKLLDRKSRLGKGRGLPKKGKSILNKEGSTVVTKAWPLSKACECLSKSHLYFRFHDFKGKVLHPHIHVVLSSILVVFFYMEAINQLTSKQMAQTHLNASFFPPYHLLSQAFLEISRLLCSMVNAPLPQKEHCNIIVRCI